MSEAPVIDYPKHGEPCDGPPPWCRPAWVVISRIAGQNAVQGVVENSFSMGRSPDRINIWCTMKNAQSTLLNALVGAEIKFQTSGENSARSCAEKNLAGNEVLEAYDVEDPNLPIVIDWTAWWADNEPVTTTLSGVRDKFKARNAPFTIKES